MSNPEALAAPARVAGKLRTTLDMIKFEHSIFVLPFALTGAMLAGGGWPRWQQVAWIIVAMVGARSAAMTFNRIADFHFDAQNPRTERWALPSGRLTKSFAIGFTAACSLLLVVAAHQLNPLAFKLSPLALALLFGYSYTKRFTWLSHFMLGICMGSGPVAAWIALRGDLKPGIALLGVGVCLWGAGFDMIYSCQDVNVDRRLGLCSIPGRFGIAAALYGSIVAHAVMLIILLLVAKLEHMGWLAILGLALVALLLGYEHALVRPSDLSRVNAAFFTVNGYISVLFFLTWAGDILLHKP
jgi:4-hydroxybenzoate polyprenyltransferase